MNIQLVCDEVVAFPSGLKLVHSVLFNPTDESYQAIVDAQNKGGYHTINVTSNGGNQTGNREHRIMAVQRTRNVVIFHSSER